jgi:hypothetical protein
MIPRRMAGDVLRSVACSVWNGVHIMSSNNIENGMVSDAQRQFAIDERRQSRARDAYELLFAEFMRCLDMLDDDPPPTPDDPVMISVPGSAGAAQQPLLHVVAALANAYPSACTASAARASSS